ncbi:MAG: DUF1905 domain-containing protein [Erysipelotrichaceae bacterium]|nr:DUF1905 domain-containing protein [Erysipelotrichaceae bacterium]
MNDTVLEFDAVIIKADDMDAAYVQVPYDIFEIYGKRRLKVHASFDGQPYDGLVLKMGTPCYIIGIRKDIRALIGKQPGDEVHVSLKPRE